jgi:glycosyltransferase involved in cell wall biosynthesis
VETTPTISILIPIWRLDAELFALCIDSVANQTYPVSHTEVVVCYDGTPPDEIDVADKLLDRLPCSHISLRTTINRGMAHARNSCAAAATSEWITLLDHDDRLATHALARLASAAVDSVDLVYANYMHVARHEEILLRSNAGPFHKLLTKERSGINSPIWHTTYILQPLLIRRHAFWAHLGFNPMAGLAHEVDLRLRLFEGRNFAYIDDCLYVYVRRLDSMYHLQHDRLVADTCAVLMRHFRQHQPAVVTCKRLGKLEQTGVTVYGFFDHSAQLVKCEHIDYDFLTFATASRVEETHG